MADSQNAPHPDQTPPLATTPSASPSALAPEKTAPGVRPAQMELLKTSPAAAPAQEKHSPDKTQPLKAMPPAAASSHQEAVTASAAPNVEATKAPAQTPAASSTPASTATASSAEEKYSPNKTQPLSAMPSAAATSRQEAPKASATSAAQPSPNVEATKTSTLAVLASAASAQKHKAGKAQSLNAPAPATSYQEAKAAVPPVAAASSQGEAMKTPAPAKVEAAKAPTATPVLTPSSSRVEVTRTPVTQTSASPATTTASPRGEAGKAPQARKESAQVPAGEHMKTVTMAATPPPPSEIEQVRPVATPVRDRLRWFGHKITTTALFTEILPGAGAKLRAYAALTRLNKPIGIYLLLWPVLWALWLSSNGQPDPHVFIVFVLGTVLTRSAGCAINDFADRNFDGHVKRTRDRPLVTGAVDPIEAIAICGGLGLVALGLALTLNQITQLLTLVGGVLVITYPFLKRFFPLPQAYLGVAFTWSVPMAYAAQTNAYPPRMAWVMFMAGLLWTVAYDTMYAMVDREDDKKIGIRSSALLFGDADRFIIGIMQLMTLLAMWLIGQEMELGLWYRLGIAFAAVFALYQQLLIRQRKPEDCFRAFLNNNYFGMSIFIGIALDYTFR